MLPTMQLLYVRRVSNNLICPVFQKHQEGIIHALVLYPDIKAMWRAAHVKLPKEMTSFTKQWFELGKNVPTNTLNRCCAIWGIGIHGYGIRVGGRQLRCTTLRVIN